MAFAKLLPALQEFHRLHGHYAVPLRFTVPQDVASQGQQLKPATNDWPEDLKGMKLGTTLSRFCKVAHKPENQSLKAELATQGVPMTADWKQFLWKEVTMTALRTFQSIEGHFFIPYTFVVPEGDDRWPRTTWGYRLGFWVGELRRRRHNLELYQLEDLFDMEFVWDARAAKWNQFYAPAMRQFTSLFGHSHVPQTFVVPATNDWPLELHGYRLGQKVNNLRCGQATLSGMDDGDEDEDVAAIKSWFLLDMLKDQTSGEGEGGTKN